MNHSFETLETSLTDAGVFQIILNRPDKLNALSEALLDELMQAFKHAKMNPDIKAVLITGNGKAFCAGADIKRLAELNAQTGYAFAREGQALFRELENLGKPSVAAINGFAFGGGCELALAASMRIASTNAKFAQPEVKLGLMPGYGGTQRLARMVGKGRAIELCTTGRTIGAKEALAFGLVNEITEPDDLLPRAHEILASILKQAPIAVGHTLRVINEGYDLSLEDACSLEAAYFALCCGTQDKQEGVNAFLSKRQPTFRNE